MTKEKFQDTAEGIAFIASADSRETSKEVMETIAFFARNLSEAEKLYNGDFYDICSPQGFQEHLSKNGLLDIHSFYWGGSPTSVAGPFA